MAEPIPGVGAVILAAGSSSRLGRPKQLVTINGVPLVALAVDAAQMAGLSPVVVVVGHQSDAVRSAVPAEAHVVLNADYATGQASSLVAGIQGLPDDVARAVVLLADQPGVTPTVIRQVAVGPGPIRRARYRDGQAGHPVAFDRELWPDLMLLHGDRGARDLIASRSDRVHEVSVDDVTPLDLDTPADAKRLGVDNE